MNAVLIIFFCGVLLDDSAITSNEFATRLAVSRAKNGLTNVNGKVTALLKPNAAGELPERMILSSVPGKPIREVRSVLEAHHLKIVTTNSSREAANLGSVVVSNSNKRAKILLKPASEQNIGEVVVENSGRPLKIITEERIGRLEIIRKEK